MLVYSPVNCAFSPIFALPCIHLNKLTTASQGVYDQFEPIHRRQFACQPRVFRLLQKRFSDNNLAILLFRNRSEIFID